MSFTIEKPVCFKKNKLNVGVLHGHRFYFILLSEVKNPNIYL